MIEVHQILPSLNYGDAIGNHALDIKETLSGWGFNSHIYAETGHTKLSHMYQCYKEHRKRSSSENILIYHHCIGGTEVFKYFLRVPDKKVLIYHNITPHPFFEKYSAELYRRTKQGREELLILKDIVSKAIGVSEYNCKELEDMGFKDITVLPIPIYLDKFASAKPNENIIRFYDDGFTNILFVGRISPNKCQDDLLKIFNYYKKNINPKSRLFIVGSYIGMEPYCNYLLEVIGEGNIRDVVLTGHTTFDELIAYYKLAHVFLCMSEHEGFCVPLLESMYFNVPIIAYNSSGIPYTVGKAGILVDTKREDFVAELINVLIQNIDLRNTIIKTQRARLNDFEKGKTDKILRDCLKEIKISVS